MSLPLTSAAGTPALKGNFRQLRELKAEQPGLRVLITVGGWGGSKYCSDVAATRKARNRFSTFISYDNPASIATKSRYTRRQGLRGVMAWEVSQDSGARTLVRALSPKRVRQP